MAREGLCEKATHEQRSERWERVVQRTRRPAAANLLRVRVAGQGQIWTSLPVAGVQSVSNWAHQGVRGTRSEGLEPWSLSSGVWMYLNVCEATGGSAVTDLAFKL